MEGIGIESYDVDAGKWLSGIHFFFLILQVSAITYNN